MLSVEDYHLARLPPDKCHNVMQHLYGDIFYKFKYFFVPAQQWETCKFKYQIAMHLQPREFEAFDDVIEQGELQ